ncbi:MAG: hypothetical protein ACYCTB_10590 [bacterium]
MTDKKTVYIGIKITKEESEEIKQMQADAAKKGMRLTTKAILNRAFEIGLEQAEKEIEEIKRKKQIKDKSDKIKKDSQKR